MTKQEASERYNIPIWLLDEYESWGLCQEVKKVMGSWQYDDSDLERLSMIMTLHDVGFTGSEIETYMLSASGGRSHKGAANANAHAKTGACVGRDPLQGSTARKAGLPAPQY